MADSVEPTVTFKQGSSDKDNDPSSSHVELNIDSNLEKSNETNLTAEEINEARDSFNNANNYDNKAFELEDIDIDTNKQTSNPFSRQDRPGSMMSIKSSTSTSSRSSINCQNGRVKCPNLRLKRFFSYRPDTGFTKASTEIQQLILPAKDGAFIGNWLLIEISNWDFHREKIVLLTEKTLIVVAYDFIKSRITDYQRIDLNELKRVQSGTLTYPQNSFMGQYEYGAVKLVWGDENLSFFKKWNPLNTSIPFIMFTSHHILYNDKEKETALYNCDEFIASLEFAINKLPEGSKIEIKEEPIVIENYANFASVLYNQNWFGFQLDRNGLNF